MRTIMINLLSNSKVLACIWNGEFDVDGTRRGGAVVIAFDRMVDENPRFVTWECWPNWNDPDHWIAEQGHYGLNWDEAWDSMVERARHIDRNQDVMKGQSNYVL